MFLRFPISSCLGFSVFVVTQVSVQNFSLSLQDIFVLGIEPAAQFLVGISATVIPLYFLRLGFGFFKGWTKKEKEKIEKQNEEEITLSSNPQQP